MFAWHFTEMPYPILAPLDALSTMRVPLGNHASTVKSVMLSATDVHPQIGEVRRTKPLSTRDAAE
jgi:hypothetical protein